MLQKADMDILALISVVSTGLDWVGLEREGEDRIRGIGRGEGDCGFLRARMGRLSMFLYRNGR